MDWATDDLTQVDWAAEFIWDPQDDNPDWTPPDLGNAASPESTDAFTPRSEEWELTYSHPMFADLGNAVDPSYHAPTETLSPVSMPAMDSLDNPIDSQAFQYIHPDPAQRD